MKPFNFFRLLFIAVPALLLAGCSRYAMSISASPQNGAPSDIIVVTVDHAKIDQDAQVQIGDQKAMIVSLSDSSASVMVPSLP